MVQDPDKGEIITGGDGEWLQRREKAAERISPPLFKTGENTTRRSVCHNYLRPTAGEGKRRARDFSTCND